MLKAILFDMDGVIVDTEPLHRKAYHQMFDDVNINVDSALYESFTGQSTINICKRLVEHFGLTESPEYLMSLKRKHYKYLFTHDDELALIDGVLALIKYKPSFLSCASIFNDAIIPSLVLASLDLEMALSGSK